MNEVPAGLRWPSTEEQLERTEEALTIITRLLDGDTVYLDGKHFRATGAVLYSRPDAGRRCTSPPSTRARRGSQAGSPTGSGRSATRRPRRS